MSETAAQISYSEAQELSLHALRDALRFDSYTGHTAGLCAGRLQCNLVILPNSYAADFRNFCDRNPKACPLVAVSEPGQPYLPSLDSDVDLRRDVPLFHLYRNGQFDLKLFNIETLWQEDLTAFAIGCSFSFERALLAAGIPLRHHALQRNVPMFQTTVHCVPSGAFSGPVVVSMRPVREEDLAQVVRICEAYPHAHGAPFHIGDPKEIGISDISAPDWGDATPIKDGEVPVFWGCGVTTQVALATAAPELAITHAPGAMLILNTDDKFVTTHNQ
ncbi:putative hydro-lyase [Epibacterium ulvae]|uniref:putative hydro-lyase n=1 Tax=Epibacterium ulvae TaxID=1156985 RepID=UPI001BFBFBDE|nr:putative hydro-lyase [Epibacterium ulvae]MBT8153421.1 putative hydro-lyase [Epibacterium ulvae]